MHILIDAHMLGEREGGNETYIAGLLQGFERVSLPESVCVTVLHRESYALPLQSGSGLRTQILENGGNFFRVFAQIPRLCHRLQADVLHMTYNASPWLPCPLVLTVHDVIFRRYPQYFSPRVLLLLSTLLPLSMWRAAVILTDSDASRSEIIHYYPFTRNKIVVAPLAPGPAAGLAPDLAAVERYSAGKEFILAVGTVQPRKNIARLIQAYISLRQRGVTQARLVIVGRSAWQGSDIQRIAHLNPYHADIQFTGYLDDAMLAGLYRRCLAFVYPSLAEGFGLPVLEAMACGAPVITSNCSSLPEVAGQAALLVNPYSVDEISARLEQLLTNPGLRGELRARSLKQAARFSWERTARETLSAYHQAWQVRQISYV